ncbi:hypothetical protein [Streptomyces melanogenes]|uniref:hypothetical protein n=1 Tax=Streptomyces melanogenes TaxID=67326 RepID=UPI00167E30FC|nr:hypothetical protein [Streptomyces melanogenes]GGP89493.1 hypothetical protein GCM10010278_79980 [Streptomyces melanogenes]
MSRTPSSPSANGRRGRSLAARSLATAGIAVAAVAGVAAPAMANDGGNHAALSLDRAVPHNGPVSGTGQAHHQVTVSRANGDVLCHAVVGADRTWSCLPEDGLPAGHAFLKARDDVTMMATPMVSVTVVNTKTVPVADPAIAAGAALAVIGAAALWYRRRAEQ